MASNISLNNLKNLFLNWLEYSAHRLLGFYKLAILITQCWKEGCCTLKTKNLLYDLVKYCIARVAKAAIPQVSKG